MKSEPTHRADRRAVDRRCVWPGAGARGPSRGRPARAPGRRRPARARRGRRRRALALAAGPRAAARAARRPGRRHGGRGRPEARGRDGGGRLGRVRARRRLHRRRRHRARRAARGPPPRLVYLDEHPDLDTPASVPTGTLDWMGVAHLLGEPGPHPSPGGARSPGSRPSPRPTSRCCSAPTPSTARRTSARPPPGGAPPAAGAAATRSPPTPPSPRRRGRLELVDPRGRAPLVVHFDVDVVEFTDAPLSENVGRGEGVPLDTGARRLRRPSPLVTAPRGRHADRAQPAARRGGRLGRRPASPTRSPPLSGEEVQDEAGVDARRGRSRAGPRAGRRAAP